MAKHKKGADSNLPARPAGGMAIAANWPVYEVLLSPNWDKQAQLITILVARRSPTSGKVAAGSFLVDLACLGVKSVQVKLFKTASDYAAELRAHIVGMQPMAPADFNLVAKIIQTGLEYAAQLGFKPDPVFAQAQPLLNGADPAAVSTPMPIGGPEGKPLFIAGPYDNAHRIVDQLVRTVGVGNFHYFVGGSQAALGLSDEFVRNFDELAEREKEYPPANMI